MTIRTKFFTLWTTWQIWRSRIQSPAKHLRLKLFPKKSTRVNYFCKILHPRCLTEFWIRLCLNLRYLILYLFFQNANFVLKSSLPYQFWNCFTVAIRVRSRDSIIATSIILDHYDIINCWGSQDRAFLFQKIFCAALMCFMTSEQSFKILRGGWC